jgi:hypothetical protein
MIGQSNRLTVLAHEINAAHTLARQHAHKSVESAISAGEALLEAKEQQLKHGEWLPWLRDNCKISERSARVYMRLAKHKDEVLKNGSAADWSIRGALDALLEPDPLAAHAERINAASNGYMGACAEMMGLLDECRQFFQGHGGDEAFKAWVAEQPVLGTFVATAIVKLLDLPKDKWATALSDALLDAHAA